MSDICTRCKSSLSSGSTRSHFTGELICLVCSRKEDLLKTNLIATDRGSMHMCGYLPDFEKLESETIPPVSDNTSVIEDAFKDISNLVRKIEKEISKSGINKISIRRLELMYGDEKIGVFIHLDGRIVIERGIK